jgi:hypothetical protein
LVFHIQSGRCRILIDSERLKPRMWLLGRISRPSQEPHQSGNPTGSTRQGPNNAEWSSYHRARGITHGFRYESDVKDTWRPCPSAWISRLVNIRDTAIMTRYELRCSDRHYSPHASTIPRQNWSSVSDLHVFLFPWSNAATLSPVLVVSVLYAANSRQLRYGSLKRI